MIQPASVSEPCCAARLSLRDGLVLALLVAAGAMLRIPQLHESLWVDELHTAWTAADGVSQIAQRATYGNQSPLYFYLSAASLEIFGSSEAALRGPSLGAGLLLIAAVYVAVLAWTNQRSAAVLAALLAALDRDALFYSLEARPYALVQLGGLLHAAIWMRTARQPTAGWRLLAISGAALLFYLHYTAALLAAAELIWLAAMRRLRPQTVQYRSGQAAIDLAVLALLCLPAAPHVAWVASRRANWESIVSWQPLWTLWLMFPVDCYLLPPLAVLALSGIFRRWRRVPTTANGARRDAALLAACWLIVPLAAVWLTTYLQIAPLLLRRYVIVVTAAPIILSAVLFAACATRAARTVCFAAVVGWAAIAPGGLWLRAAGQPAFDGPLCRFLLVGEFADRPREDWRAAIAAINSDRGAARLPVLVRSGLIEDDALRDSNSEALRSYCLFPVRSLYPIDETDRPLAPLPSTNSGQLCADVQQQIVDRGGAWLLLRASPSDAALIVDDVLQSLQERAVAARVVRQDSNGGLMLVKILIQASE